MTSPATTPPAAGTSRGGRPRRHVALAGATLNPLLSDEHRQAVLTLSALLLDAGDSVAADLNTTTSGTPGEGTAAILNALSLTGDTMTPPAPTRRDRAA